MQDSLEDYLRISRNVKEGPTQQKKEVLVTAQIKKECDAKALQILQFAIEGKMRSDALFRCLPYINQSQYQDIVEERAISKLCGYPLCSKRIPEMPKKQFYISTKNNKVYDITDRKHYCSNFCYRASIHVKSQIDTSPLWLRKQNEKAHFTLLSKSEKGLPGEVVDQGVTKTVPPEPIFTSISNFTQMSLDEAEEFELNSQEEEEENKKKKIKKPKKFQKNTMKTINENEEEEVEKEEKTLSSPSQEKTTFQTNTNVESHINKCFQEWLTLETYIFIYGEAKVKEKIDTQKLSDYFESLKIAEAQVEQQKKYIDICRKLHLKQLADEKFDSCVVGKGKFRPIPDYQELRQENKEIDSKVKSFYSGELHIQEDSNFPMKKEVKENEEEAPQAILPLVDVHSQNALRRKIFLGSLNKTIQNLFQNLRLSPSLVSSDLQSLVKTFNLKPDNIVFKPQVWNYVAVILLKILSVKDDKLRSLLDSDLSKEHLSSVLSPLPNKDKLVNDILNILSDVTTFIEDYLKCT